MIRSADTSPEDLKRIPGLFRRWELPEIFEPHRNYHIEEAGVHADGTPLLALYVSDPAANEGERPAREGGNDTQRDPRAAIPSGLLPEEMIAALPLILEFWETEREEPILRPLFASKGATIDELREAIRELGTSIEGERRTLRALSGLLDELVGHGASASTRVADMLKVVAGSTTSGTEAAAPCRRSFLHPNQEKDI